LLSADFSLNKKRGFMNSLIPVHFITPVLKKLSLVMVLVLSSIFLSACGNSIKNAQDFVPNKAPVITGYTLKDAVSGKDIDSSNIVIGMRIKCVISAYDPEKQELTYSFTSDFGSTLDQTVTAAGCEVVFIVLSVTAGSPVLLNVNVKDVKKAVTSTTLDVGGGKNGPVLTINTPLSSLIASTGSTTFTFNTSSDGWYQVIESSDNITNVSNAMTTLTRYTAGDNKTITIAGSLYAGTIDVNTVKVSASDGTKRVWILFKDNNNFYSSGDTSVVMDGTHPTVETTPANGATFIPTSPVISLKFSENVDQGTLASALSLTGGSVAFQSYDSVTYTASYNVTGLNISTMYTATVLNAKDIAGNEVTNKTFSFTTKSSGFVVICSPNGADSGTPPSNAEYANGSTVTVQNQGTLAKTGYTFAGWNTLANGSGTSYAAGATFSMPTNDVTLYAKWTINQYHVTYDGNSSTGGTVPSPVTTNYNDTVTVANQGSLVKTFFVSGESFFVTYLFTGWKDDLGVDRAVGSTFVLTRETTLYAQWTAIGTTGPCGGKIFLDTGSYATGWRFMEYAPAIQAVAQWGPLLTNVSGTDASIGAGVTNTYTAIPYNPSYPSIYQAAYECFSYQVAGKYGWFLPSYLELVEILKVFKPVPGWFWSSTQYDVNSAYVCGYLNGSTVPSAWYKFQDPYTVPVFVIPARRF
jgi:uncharacterized repeat protein (TIGR02543 family)